MPVTLTATQVPAVQQYSGLLTLASCETDSGNAPVGKNIALGETSTVPSKYNRNVGQMDMTARHGGGSYAIGQGFALSAGAGLTLNVAAGQAVIDGIVELAATTAVMFDNTRNHLWFKRDGTLEVKNNVLTAPATPAVYLGSVLTASGAISSVDTSGVVYMRNGLPYRETADTGQPGDSPSATVLFLTKTSGGLYLWDGAAYRRQLSDSEFDTEVENYINANWGYLDTIGNGKTLVIPAGRQVHLFESLTVSGTGSLTVNGKLKVD